MKKLLFISLAMLLLFPSCGKDADSTLPVEENFGEQYKLAECPTVFYSAVDGDENLISACGILDKKIIIGIFDKATKKQLVTIRPSVDAIVHIKEDAGYGEFKEYDITTPVAIQIFKTEKGYVYNVKMRNEDGTIRKAVVGVEATDNSQSTLVNAGGLHPIYGDVYLYGPNNGYNNHYYFNTSTFEITLISNPDFIKMNFWQDDTYCAYPCDEEHLISPDSDSHRLRVYAWNGQDFVSTDKISYFYLKDEARENFSYTRLADGNIKVTLMRTAKADGAKTYYDYVLDTKTWKFTQQDQ